MELDPIDYLLDTRDGMENPAFEVSEPDMWVTVLQRAIGGEAL